VIISGPPIGSAGLANLDMSLIDSFQTSSGVLSVMDIVA